ncbi:MAG: HDOD domain-containing protein [Candidatus Zixiibacteriota bacterium]
MTILKYESVDAIDITGELEKRNDLFALPESVVKILELSAEEDVSLETIAEVIKTDPALTGRLLKIANSSFYGMHRKMTSPMDAVMALGLTTVKCLALSVAIFNHHEVSKDLNIDIKGLYGGIVSAAAACRKIATSCEFPAPDEAFVCGMLFDIGLLFYLQYYPKYYAEIIRRVNEGGDWFEEEKKVFGISHAETGRLIALRWQLPEHIANAIGNHHSFGYKDSDTLDDILRLGVVLNLDFKIGPITEFEEKIAKISNISDRLGIGVEDLDEISSNTLTETLQFAKIVDIDVGTADELLARANHEIFNSYMSILRLFKERQELTRHILDEERQKGIADAKMIAISTLSHYINNSSMIISGQSQVIRMLLKTKSAEEIIAKLSRHLDVIDDSIKKSVAVIEEISELNSLDDIEFFDQSKILNIDDRIKERLSKIKDISVYNRGDSF